MARRSAHALVLPLLGQAARALLRHKARSALTTLGITIAIAAVVWVVALGEESARKYALLLQGLGDNLVWVEAGSRNTAGVRTGAKSATTLTLGDMEAIKRDVHSIDRISPQLDGNVTVVSERGNWSTRFRGVAPDYLPIKRFATAQGSPFTDDDVAARRDVVLLGQTVVEHLFPADSPLGQNVRMNGQSFTVVGVLAPKGQSATGQDQDDTVMLPYTSAMKKLRAQNITWVDDIVCSAESAAAVTPASRAIVALMRERHRIGPDDDDDFNIRHPEDVVKAQLEASATFSTLLLVLASVALVVGGIGIMNMMLASVTSRTREIGVRLAVGATPGAVTLQFLCEAVLLCLAGGLTGVAVSVGGAKTIGGMIGWSLTVPPRAVVLAAVVSTMVGLVFGYLPARRASRLDPIFALRYET